MEEAGNTAGDENARIGFIFNQINTIKTDPSILRGNGMELQTIEDVSMNLYDTMEDISKIKQKK